MKDKIKIRGELEKIAWKHYKGSLNVEEMLDEMMPIISLAISKREEELIKEVEKLDFVNLGSRTIYKKDILKLIKGDKI